VIAATTNSTSVGGAVVLYAVLAVMIVLRRRTRQHPANSDLVKGERLRPLAITLLDPVLSLVFAGPLLWDLATHDPARSFAAVVGASLGIPIAIWRARVQYVRAVPEAKGVVFRRSPIEYGLLGLLLLLRLLESSIEHATSRPLTFVLTGLIGLAIAESIARTTAIALRYVADARRPTNPEVAE
jgi:hypothetical protein